MRVFLQLYFNSATSGVNTCPTSEDFLQSVNSAFDLSLTINNNNNKKTTFVLFGFEAISLIAVRVPLDPQLCLLPGAFGLPRGY